jgi:hypothetical protein
MPLDPPDEGNPEVAAAGSELVTLNEYKHAPVQPLAFPASGTLRKIQSTGLLKNSVRGEHAGGVAPTLPRLATSTLPACGLNTLLAIGNLKRASAPVLLVPPHTYKFPVGVDSLADE